MKTYLPYIFIALILSSCADPMRLIQKEKDQKAFEVSMDLLKRKRIKEEHVLAFQLSFDMITQKDAASIQDLRDAGEPKLWLRILDKAESMDARQDRVKRTLRLISNKGHFPEVEMYPAEALIEEATDNVALYYYAQAMEFIPAAENDDRIKARKAYDALEKCLSYRAPFRDATELMEKMYRIGTTHILLIPELDEEALEVSENLFDAFFDDDTFPYRKDWRVLHLQKPEKEIVDYQVYFHFEDLYASRNQMSESVCDASAEVQTGCETVEVWSEKDSAYVKEVVPVFETVYREVTTFEQSKYARLKLVGNLWNFKEEESIPFELERTKRWSNSYSEESGDSRATGCFATMGCRRSYPSDGILFEGAARYVKSDLGDWLDKKTY